MTALKIIKAQITTRDEKGHVRHHNENTSSIDWGKVAEALTAPKATTTKEKKSTAATKKKD